jgi:hypothetical protein
VVKCSGVLQCNDGLSNKVSIIIRRFMENMKLLLICIDMDMSYARAVRTASLTSYPVRCKM